MRTGTIITLPAVVANKNKWLSDNLLIAQHSQELLLMLAARTHERMAERAVRKMRMSTCALIIQTQGT
jgi:hypothetical protein